MKKIIFLLAIGLTVGYNAQSQNKLAYVNSQELLEVMPEAKAANETLQKYVKDLTDQNNLMMTDMKTKSDDYTANSKTWSEVKKEVKEKELTDLNKSIQDFQASADDKIAKKKNEVLKPLYDKAQKAIKEVSAEGGYDFVFDGSQLLYAKDANDITPKVKAKLGIK